MKGGKVMDHFENALFGIEKVNAILEAIESSYLTYEIPEDQWERFETGVYLFYVMRDEVREVMEQLRSAGREIL